MTSLDELPRRPIVAPLATTLLALLAATLLATPAPAQTQPGSASSGGDVIAVVEGLPIRQFEWDRLAGPYYRDVEAEAGRKLSETEKRLLRQNVLHELIRERLWIADAKRRGMTVTDAEIDARMKQSAYFKTNGRVDEGKFLAFKRSTTSNYPELRAQLQMGLLLEQYTRWMERRFGPREAELKQAFRERTMQATLRYLLLGPETVSLEPVATEAEIRAYYDEHPAEFLAPEEARIQYVKVQVPVEAAAGDSAREAASQAGLKAAKDLLSAIQAGAPPETAARLHGGFHDTGTFRVGEPIRGLGKSEALVDALHATEAGAWIKEPVRIGPLYVVARVLERKAARPVPFREAVPLAKRRADAEKRDAQIDSLARAELRGPANDYRRPRLVASVLARPLAAFEDPKPVSAKDVSKALNRLRKEAGVRDTARAWLDSVRTTLPATIAAERRAAAAAKAMRDIASDLARGDPADAVAKRRLASLSRVDLWRGQPPENAGLAEGAFLDSLYDLRPGSILGPRVSRDTMFVARVDSLDTDFVPPYDAVKQEARSAALLQRRRTTEREAEAWFADHRERYLRPIRFVLDVVLFPKTKSDTTLVAEDSVVAYHRDHALEFTEPARVRARHILFAVQPSEPPRAKEAARAKAVAARARIKKGEDFEALARELSDDKGSAARGGDLGELLRSQLVPEFGTAAFVLPVGEVSEPVLTQFGYHLIRVDARTPERLRPIEECRSEIRKLLADQIADTLARRGAEALIEAARDSASLAALAAPAGGVHRYGPVGNTDRVGPLEPMLGLSDWLGPVAEGSIAPTPLGTAEGYVVARKVRDVPPMPAPYAEVKERVIADYQLSERRALSDSLAAGMREALAAGADLESLAVVHGGLRLSKPFGRSGPIPDLARDATLGRDSLYLERVFAAKPGAQLAPLQGTSGTLFARVESITEPPAADYAKRRDEIHREIVEQRTEAWTDRLRSRATITIERADLRGLER
ncbi:MAG TPA: peptidyl-prolyl cis-trans isomerase [Candidatus Eisenbacteria bacterium]|nr:peptidyl-prolyl cis-trans isomerase [Candidatus Eisenbacteria bacterium]